jgi:hypothetical protein
MEDRMFKLKIALVAAAIVGTLMTSAAVSILGDVSTRMRDPTNPAQIDRLDLMSKARDLPTQTIESPI